ncbi:MAG: GDP-mannose 4,6-dehydratase [Clostridia bacterium]|nr:GDP-mannose 4,6-dehydratase [Clostridia bacterium]
MKRALITGITGQDGSFLAELLLSKGYEVYGLIRRKSTLDYGKVEHLKNDIKFVTGDMTDFVSLVNAVKESKPDEVYNLAAQSFVAASFGQPVLTFSVNAMGCENLLEAIKQEKSDARFYQASTSELFGNTKERPQNEKTSFKPESPYAISKLAAHYITQNYRDGYGIFASTGILFNHESERRGKEFVTRKVTDGVAKIKLGKQEYIELGNLDARRDWGYSKEYVRAIWLILQQEKPDDFVIATGESHTVREFVELAFKYAGIDIVWQGTGVDEVAINTANNKVVVKINKQFFRPLDVNYLVGDSTKAFNTFGWKSEVSFEELVKLMVENDLKENC